MSTQDPQQLFYEELLLLLRVPYPLLALRGAEEHVICALLERCAQQLQLEVFRGSTVSPLQKLSDKPSQSLTPCVNAPSPTRSMLEGLDLIAAHPSPALFIILEPAEALTDPRVQQRFKELAPRMVRRRQSIALVGVALQVPPALRRIATRLDAPLPSRRVLRTVLDRALPPEKHRLIPRERMVAAALGLTRDEAHRAFARARLSSEGGSRVGFPWEAEILAEKRRAITQGDVVTFVEAKTQLNDVGGLDELKAWLKTRKAAFSQEARRFGLPVPKGLLLIGVQGCGKSLVAKAVANHWSLPLLRLDLGSVFAGHYAPDAALHRALQVSEALSPSVLWIDEIEKGFGAQADGNAMRILGSLLTWLQEKTSEVFFVATANEVEALPPELLRKGRFDEMFFVDLPDRDAREQILEIHLNKHDRTPGDFDLSALSQRTEHFSGAELEQVIIAGLYEAFAEGRELSQGDLEQTASALVPLYMTREDAIKRLRDWARQRARFAAHDKRVLEFFGGGRE